MKPKITPKLISAEEAEECDFVVCCRKGSPAEAFFDDDVYGVCAHCGHAIFYRPTVPKRPPKICMECAAEMATSTQH